MPAKQSAKLVMMANQIAKNTAIQGEDRAVEATYRQFKLFWEPRMRENLAGHIKSGGGKDLHPIVLKAFEKLAVVVTPQPQATQKPAAAKSADAAPAAKSAVKPAAKPKKPAKT